MRASKQTGINIGEDSIQASIPMNEECQNSTSIPTLSFTKSIFAVGSLGSSKTAGWSNPI